MPSITQGKVEIKNKQLIPPKPVPVRSKPYQLSGNDEWLIYPHGKTVYLYNLKDHSLNMEYREHAYPVGVAKLSPSGRFIASGDQCGNLRIFDSKDLNTKLEAKVLGGMINDLSWSQDEKFIAVSGEGRDQFANVVKIEGGEIASYGELTGPSKSCPTINLHSPFCILGSDDKSLTVYRAAPKFKFIKTLRDHEGFVQVARFCPDGSKFVTAGADGRVFTYSTESFEVLLNGVKLHDAGILALEWVDNDTIITGSADKSLKLWNSRDGTILKASKVSSDWTFEHQICGILVQENSIIVLRLNGSFEARDLNSLELLSNNCTLFNALGHSKSIVDLSNVKGASFSSVSYDGIIKTWNLNDNNSLLSCEKEIVLKSCKNVQKLTENGVISENKLIELDNNDKEEVKEFSSKIVASFKERIILSEGTFDFPIELATFNADGSILALTSSTNLNLYSISAGNVPKLIQSFNDLTAKISAMSFSLSNSLAIADEQRRIKVYSYSEAGWTRESSQWCNHSARIDSLLWAAEMILSAGVDGNIMAWSLAANKIGPLCTAKAAHSGPINKLQLIKEEEGESVLFVSAAGDSCIKVHELTY